NTSLCFCLAVLRFFYRPFSINQRDSLRVGSGMSRNVEFFRLARELPGRCGRLCPGLKPLFWQLSFWRYVGWLVRSSSLASLRARGWLTRCSFAARLRCHCCSFKISLMTQAFSNGSHVSVRLPAGALHRTFRAPLFRPPPEYRPNPAHLHRAILLNW